MVELSALSLTPRTGGPLPLRCYVWRSYTINVSRDRLPVPGMQALNHSKVKYVWNKGSIVGPAWKIPFIGPFLESVNPKFEKYHEKWMSGPLSCVSVFHK